MPLFGFRRKPARTLQGIATRHGLTSNQKNRLGYSGFEPETAGMIAVAKVGGTAISAATESGGVRTPGTGTVTLQITDSSGDLVDYTDDSGSAVTVTVLNWTLFDSPTNDYVMVKMGLLDGQLYYEPSGNGADIFFGKPNAAHGSGKFATYSKYLLSSTGPVDSNTDVSNVYQESSYSYATDKWHWFLQQQTNDGVRRFWSYPVQFIDCVSSIAETELTLDSNTAGQITVLSGTIVRHSVDTFDNQLTGDLATINGGVAGQLLILRAKNASRTIVLKDNADNIRLNADRSLDGTQDVIILYRSPANWLEMSFADNNV